MPTSTDILTTIHNHIMRLDRLIYEWTSDDERYPVWIAQKQALLQVLDSLGISMTRIKSEVIDQKESTE